jgi:hypothetical protein
MWEFIIRPIQEEWFEFPESMNPTVLQPLHIMAEAIPGWGSHRIKVEDTEIAFSIEDPGIQVIFYSDRMPHHRAREIVEAICLNIHLTLGQGTRIVEL